MFRKITIFSILFLLLAAGMVSFFSIQLRPSDLPNYTKMMQDCNELHSKKALERSPAHQARSGVRKEIWAMDGDERNHMSLFSEGSDLIVHQKKDKFEAVEELQNLEFTMEKGEHRPKIKANRGNYSISDFQTFELAEEVVLSETNGLTAQGGSCLYKDGKAILYPKAPYTHCTLTSPEDRIDAMRISFDYAAKELVCEGNVRLRSMRVQGKESFAIAETLSYKPDEKRIVLTSSYPKRVLFWQDDMRLSAREVHICPDPDTKLETIEGIGDIHFAFDLAEESAIHEFFRSRL